MDGSLMLPLSRRLNVPLVVTFHGYDVTMRPDAVPRRDFLHRTYLRQRSRLQKEGALFIAVSGFIRDRLLEQGFPPERTIVHYIGVDTRSEEHTSELQSLMRISYAVFCLKKTK